MQAASYLYSLAHPELIASILYYIFWPLPYGNCRKSTSTYRLLVLAIHVVMKLINQYLLIWYTLGGLDWLDPWVIDVVL